MSTVSSSSGRIVRNRVRVGTKIIKLGLTNAMAPVLVLFLLLLLSSTHSTSASKILDGTQAYKISTAVDYHYMLTLYSDSTDGTLEFHWNPITYQEVNTSKHSNKPKYQQQKVWSCRLLHKSRPAIIEDDLDISNALSNAPSWLGFGIQDKSKANSSGRNLMLKGDATVGSLKHGVKQYKLWDTVEGSPAGVTEVTVKDNAGDPLPFLSDQSIIEPGLETIDAVQGKKVHVVSFDFVFSIPYTERYTGGKFREKEQNLFIFAVGPTTDVMKHSNLVLGSHTKAGGFTLDLSQIGDNKEMSYETPIKKSDCRSDDIEYSKMIHLPHKTKFYWNLDRGELDAQLSHLGNAWLGFGVPNDSRGKMIGADAIIGIPALDSISGGRPIQYKLFEKNQKGVVPVDESSAQNLIYSHIHQDDQETILRFVRNVEGDNNQNDISISGETTFIYAIGDGNVLAKHAYAGKFSLDLTSCPNEETKDQRFKSHWIAHGVFGTLAFAVFTPASITSALLRQLLPTTWIYVHVYGNMIAFTCTLIAVFIALSTTSMSYEQHFVETHHKIGLTLLILHLTQVCLGLFRPSRDVRQSSMELRKRQIWKFIHSVLGITILSFGIYQVGDGLLMFAEDYNSINLAPYYIACMIVSIIVVSGVTLYLFIYSGGEKAFLPVEMNPNHTTVEADRLDENSAYLETEMTNMSNRRNIAADMNNTATTDIDEIVDLNASSTGTDMDKIMDLSSNANVDR